jgi:hypothetical protein
VTAGGHSAASDVAPAEAAARITVALVSKAAVDLQRIRDRTRLSKTDIVNRAISLYEFIDAELSIGHDVLIRNNAGETQLVKFL